jgi:integrase/recombinase XerD
VARHGAQLLPEVPRALRAPVEDYLTLIELERGLSRNTVDAYARDLGRYLQWLHDRGTAAFTQVTEQDLLAFRARLEEDGLAPASRARIVVAIRRLHDHLLGEGVVTSDPAAALPPPRQAERLPSGLTLSQVEALLRTTQGEEAVQQRAAALLELLYATGARISEAVGLDLDDLDLTHGTVRLYGKGSKERLVPVGSHARTALEAWLVRSRPALAARARSADRAGAVFLNQRGGAGGRRGRHAPHPAPHLRDPPAGGRGGHPRRAGAPGPRVRRHDPDLHAGDRAVAPRGVRLDPPPRDRLSRTAAARR